MKELKNISKDEFGELVEGECFGCGDELDSEEFNLCWWCVFHELKHKLRITTPWVFIICKKCGLYNRVAKLCHRCN